MVGAITGSLLDGPSETLLLKVGAGVPALQDGQWWTPLTAAFFAADLLTYLGVTVLLLIIGSLCERRWGSVKMAWMTLLVQIVGVGARSRRGRAVQCAFRLGVGRVPGRRHRGRRHHR